MVATHASLIAYKHILVPDEAQLNIHCAQFKMGLWAERWLYETCHRPLITMIGFWSSITCLPSAGLPSASSVSITTSMYFDVGGMVSLVLSAFMKKHQFAAVSVS